MVKMQMIGHLGKDAVIGNAGGKTVINMTVAHSEKYNDAQGQQQTKTIWVDCAYWTDKTAVAQYLVKGAQVHLDGLPDVSSYSNAHGAVVPKLTLRVLNVQLLGNAQQAPQQQQAAPQQAQQQQQYQQAIPGQTYAQPQQAQQQQYHQPAPPPPGGMDDLPF